MADEVYKIAIERARKLRAELERLDSFIATYEELSSSPPIAAPEPAPAHEPPQLSLSADAPQPAKAVPQGELERIAMRVLLENGAPLQRQALFERVKATGTAIGGSDERANFGSKMSRSTRFVNLPKLGYWPADKPCEAAGYQPGGTA
ncbi:MAG: hypothetical protein ACKVP7_25760 [Hyphomicrobiaceae bacterium]